ncbi:MAG: glycosyltransferase [Gemmatimonadota bacterium]
MGPPRRPLVSVLLPVYDAGATLAETLASLAAQTLEDYEMVAVDDGSTDGSLQLLQDRAVRDPRVRPLPGAHAGLVPALNRGLSACRGDYVARMDADDLAHPERLARQVALLQADPGLSVASCLVETFPAASVGAGFRIYEAWLNRLVTHADICREIYIESPIPHPTAVVRRLELGELGGYRDVGWPEDYDLWLRYHQAGRRFAKVPEVLLRWREHPGRLTHTDSRYSVENFLRAKAHFLAAGPLRGRQVIVWGAGKTGRRLSKHLVRAGRPPTAFVDIAAHRLGRSLRGAPIIGPAALPALWRAAERPFLVAAVSSRGARELIRQALREMGLVEVDDYLCAA